MKKRTVKYLLFFAVAAAAAFGVYRYAVPDKYKYWNKLIAQDPKPDGVSEKEYREKLRAGYCWRDRKFYTAEELQQKAMVSFSGRLLGETDAYWSDETTTIAGPAYTSEDCARSKTACRVWFIPQNYTNEQWDQLFLAKKDSEHASLIKKYLQTEIKQSIDLKNYIAKWGSRKFSIYLNGDIYGSDCCKVLGKEEVKPLIDNSTFITYSENAAIFPENKIPKGINIETFGVGNFYFKFKGVTPSSSLWDNTKTHQWGFSKILLMNNCGDVLWQPYYIS